LRIVKGISRINKFSSFGNISDVCIYVIIRGEDEFMTDTLTVGYKNYVGYESSCKDKKSASWWDKHPDARVLKLKLQEDKE